jgi:ketosteroid isomerase-like protein
VIRIKIQFSKPVRSIFFFLLFLPLFAFAQSKCEQKILDTEQRRFEAMVRKDTLAPRDLLADDLVYIHSNTLTENKKEHISAISTGRLIYEKMLREHVRVRRYGKMALTNGIVQVKGILKEKTFEMRLAYTAVYRKKGGTWWLVNWQSTRVP